LLLSLRWTAGSGCASGNFNLSVEDYESKTFQVPLRLNWQSLPRFCDSGLPVWGSFSSQEMIEGRNGEEQGELRDLNGL
jgi:hypothetical protein